MSVIRSLFQPLKDKWGLISCYMNGAESGNNLRYTSEYYIILKQYTELEETDKVDFKRLVAQCFKEPGLLNRSPGRTDLEQADDYIAVLSACQTLNIKDLPQMILKYGRRNFYNYNNVTPSVFSLPSFLGRYVQLITAMKWAAGEVPNLFLRLYWCFTILFASFSKKTNQDAWALTWHLINTNPTPSWYEKLFIDFWFAKLYVNFSNDSHAFPEDKLMYEMLNGYLDQNHPIRRYWDAHALASKLYT